MPSSQDRGAARRGFGAARACLAATLVASSSSTASNSLSASLASYLNSNNETMTPTACDWLADGVTLAISGFGNNTMNEISAPSSSPQLGDDDPGPFASSAMIFNLNTTAGAVSGISRIDNRIDVLRASPAGVIIVGDIGVAFTDPGINDIVWQADVLCRRGLGRVSRAAASARGTPRAVRTSPPTAAQWSSSCLSTARPT